MARKIMIPVDLKYDFAIKAYTGLFKGFLYAIREECSAEKVYKIYERLCKMGNRIENLTKTILTIFKLEGNDARTINNWFIIWGELVGQDTTTLELSETFSRVRLTKCPMRTEYNDIGDHCKIFCKIIYNTINPKATFERPKGMCAGDLYCEFITKIEE